MTTPATRDLVAARVRAHARVAARWMAHVWQTGQASADQGLAITSAEVARLLRDPAASRATREQVLRDDPEAEVMRQAALKADAALRDDAGWRRCIETFGLSAPEGDLLCLLLGVEFDPGLHRVVAYLQDDVRATEPTAQLSATLFDDPAPLPFAVDALLRWRLATPLDGASPWRATTAWLVDTAMLRSVALGAWTDPLLEGVAVAMSARDVQSLPLLYAEQFDRLRALEPPAAIALVGTEGSGRRTLAAQFALGAKRPLLVIDTRALLARTTVEQDGLLAALRMAVAIGAWPYWRDADAIAATDWARLRRLAPLHLRGDTTTPAPAVATAAIIMPPTTVRQRETLWKHLCAGQPLPDAVCAQPLTPGEVALAAHAAPFGADAMRAMLRRAMPVDGNLLGLLQCPYVWKDLVLPQSLLAQLHELADQVRLRRPVYDDWGLRRLTPLGAGIAALFGGPSGTGKTMAAQVLARELGLDLYRIDLAGVVDKYIGETEKRLRAVFDACERSAAILFFDEADALFGQRTAVTNAHDRYANIEIDYLLQRIECFNGVAILSTNRKNDIDAAFMRRMRIVVDFLKPGPDERFALWTKALPPDERKGRRILGDVDHRFLADQLEATGAQIKSIALSAAFMAKAQRKTIGMPHLLAAAQREFAKQGATLRVKHPEGKT